MSCHGGPERDKIQLWNSFSLRVNHFRRTFFQLLQVFLTLFWLTDLDLWFASLSYRSHLQLSVKSLPLEFLQVESVEQCYSSSCTGFLLWIVRHDFVLSFALIKLLAFPFYWFWLNLQIIKLKYWLITKSILCHYSITWLQVIFCGN